MTGRDSGSTVHGLLGLGREWLRWLRNRPLGLTLIKCGVVVIGLVLGGWVLTVSVSFGDGGFGMRLASDGGVPTHVLVLVLSLGIALVLGGGTSLVADAREGRGRRVIVVELRGLRDFGGSRLANAVPREIRGSRVELLVDLRQGADGLLLAPERALDKLGSLAVQVSQLEDGAGKNGDGVVVCGSLAPVPFTFLAGALLDDEGKVVMMDWDRHQSEWRQLDGEDDGRRFEVLGTESVIDGTKEAALVVSVSYKIGGGEVRETVPDVPIVRLTLIGGTSDGHWSADQQVALTSCFLQTVAELGNGGVKLVHLFLAAPNSVVFRFGQGYDRRNHPDLVVYQYERGKNPPYPWGVQMPASGETRGVLSSAAGTYKGVG